MTLTRERDKLREEFTKSKADVEASFKELNEAKRKAYSSFNISSQNLDQRIVDNLGVLKRKLTELCSNLKLTSMKRKVSNETISLTEDEQESDVKASKSGRLVELSHISLLLRLNFNQRSF